MSSATLDTWKNDQLENAEASLTTEIDQSQDANYHLLAARARARSFATLGRSTCRCRYGASCFPLIYSTTYATLHQGHRYSTVHHCLHRKERRVRDKGETYTAYRTCDIAFEHFHSPHVTLLLLTKVRVFDLVTNQLLISRRLSSRLWLENTPMRYPTWTISHCHSPIHIDMLYSSGTCNLCYHATDITTNVSERLTCILSKGIRTWNEATTRVRYSRLNVHLRDCEIPGNHCLWWSHWQGS